jgi:multiple antibiotic resistance protein
MVSDLLSFALLSLSSVFIVVNPLGATLVYVSLSEGMNPEAKLMMARDACKIAVIILLLFAVAGTTILGLFGITLEAFRIAGGFLLFGIGMEMVYAKTSRTKLTATEKYESIDAEEVTIMPMAIPMIAGPGSITTVVVLSNEALQDSPFTTAAVLLSIIFAVFVTYILLRNSEVIMKRIGQREYRVINRLLGILLMAIAVQFVIIGIQIAFPMLTGGIP